MKNILILLFCGLLFSCAQPQIEYVTIYKIPPVPEPLMVPCDEPTLISNNNVAALIEMIMDNAPKYKVCSIHEIAWIQWYDTMKKDEK